MDFMHIRAGELPVDPSTQRELIVNHLQKLMAKKEMAKAEKKERKGLPYGHPKRTHDGPRFGTRARAVQYRMEEHARRHAGHGLGDACECEGRPSGQNYPTQKRQQAGVVRAGVPRVRLPEQERGARRARAS